MSSPLQIPPVSEVSIIAFYHVPTTLLSCSSELPEIGQHMVAPPVPESSIVVSLATIDVRLSKGKEGSGSYSSFGIEVLTTKGFVVGEGL
ncbi:hypothetical protein A2U01_0078969, partial [Trifolium medium]|nr:hypothetical protein [Trifolium medium]